MRSPSWSTPPAQRRSRWSLFIINNHVADVLAAKGIKVYKTFVGEYDVPGDGGLLGLPAAAGRRAEGPAGRARGHHRVQGIKHRNKGEPIYDRSGTGIGDLHAIGEKITEEKLYLTELDNVIGDGDHGINLARGFAEVEKKRPMMEGKDIGTMLKTAGMASCRRSAARPPLYGTAFMQAGKALAGKTELDAQDLLTILTRSSRAQLRGKSVAGEKTMLDAMIPARDAFKAALDAGKGAKDALADAVAAAEQGVEYTKTIIATKGRASYLGERSLATRTGRDLVHHDAEGRSGARMRAKAWSDL